MTKKNPCWDGYKQIGMKKKGGRKVPNCVPKKKRKKNSSNQIKEDRVIRATGSAAGGDVLSDKLAPVRTMKYARSPEEAAQSHMELHQDPHFGALLSQLDDSPGNEVTRSTGTILHSVDPFQYGVIADYLDEKGHSGLANFIRKGHTHPGHFESSSSNFGLDEGVPGENQNRSSVGRPRFAPVTTQDNYGQGTVLNINHSGKRYRFRFAVKPLNRQAFREHLDVMEGLRGDNIPDAHDDDFNRIDGTIEAIKKLLRDSPQKPKQLSRRRYARSPEEAIDAHMELHQDPNLGALLGLLDDHSREHEDQQMVLHSNAEPAHYGVLADYLEERGHDGLASLIRKGLTDRERFRSFSTPSQDFQPHPDGGASQPRWLTGHPNFSPVTVRYMPESWQQVNINNGGRHYRFEVSMPSTQKGIGERIELLQKLRDDNIPTAYPERHDRLDGVIKNLAGQLNQGEKPQQMNRRQYARTTEGALQGSDNSGEVLPSHYEVRRWTRRSGRHARFSKHTTLGQAILASENARRSHASPSLPTTPSFSVWAVYPDKTAKIVAPAESGGYHDAKGVLQEHHTSRGYLSDSKEHAHLAFGSNHRKSDMKMAELANVTFQISSFHPEVEEFRRQALETDSMVPFHALADYLDENHGGYEWFRERLPDVDESKDKRRYSRRQYAKREVVGPNQSFLSALRQLRSGNHTTLRKIADDINEKLGLNPFQAHDAVHEGFGNTFASLMQIIQRPEENGKAEYAAAHFGRLTNQPGLLVFHAHDDGPDSLYAMHLAGNPEDIKTMMDEHGIPQRTLSQTDRGYRVHVFDPNRTLRSRVEYFARTVNATVHESTGTGNRIAGQGYGNGSNAGAPTFNDIIAAYEWRGDKPGSGPSDGEKGRVSTNPGEASNLYSSASPSRRHDNKMRWQKSAKPVQYGIRDEFLRALRATVGAGVMGAIGKERPSTEPNTPPAKPNVSKPDDEPPYFSPKDLNLERQKEGFEFEDPKPPESELTGFHARDVEDSQGRPVKAGEWGREVVESAKRRDERNFDKRLTDTFEGKEQPRAALKVRKPKEQPDEQPEADEIESPTQPRQTALPAYLGRGFRAMSGARDVRAVSDLMKSVAAMHKNGGLHKADPEQIRDAALQASIIGRNLKESNHPAADKLNWDHAVHGMVADSIVDNFMKRRKEMGKEVNEDTAHHFVLNQGNVTGKGEKSQALIQGLPGVDVAEKQKAFLNQMYQQHAHLFQGLSAAEAKRHLGNAFVRRAMHANPSLMKGITDTPKVENGVANRLRKYLRRNK